MEKSQLRKDLKIGTPILHPTSFIAKGAQIIGDVELKVMLQCGIIVF